MMLGRVFARSVRSLSSSSSSSSLSSSSSSLTLLTPRLAAPLLSRSAALYSSTPSPTAPPPAAPATPPPAASTPPPASNNATAPTSSASDLNPPPLFDNVIAERRGKVGIVRLNRPKQFNALSDGLVKDITNALLYFQEDKEVGAMILIGGDKAFAAGADIREMEKKTYMDCIKTNMLAQWQDIPQKIRKPIVAAVNGFALGGGCELAMICDIIVASETAVFGQPEIRLGTIPGCGGTQRLVRAIGKSKAMEMVLTGSQMTAHEAEKAGLVSRVVPVEKLLDEALRVAGKIASFSQPIVAMCKEAVNSAYELSLHQGLNYERRLFHGTFASVDQKEGMNAFVEKREPTWKNE